MTGDSVGRRNVLRSAGAAAGGVVVGGVAVPTTAAAGEHARDGDVSGSWRVNVHNDDGAESISILSFAGGEVCLVHDISPAGPPFTGTWRSGAHGWFRATVLTGTPGDGPGSTGAVIELRLRGTVRNRRVSGSFTFRVTDAAGVELATGSGTFDGDRIAA